MISWEEKDDRLNESMNDGGDCRTALATPSLLIIQGDVMSPLISSNMVDRNIARIAIET